MFKIKITLIALFAFTALTLAPAAVRADGIGELKQNLGAFGTQTGLTKNVGDQDLKGKVASVINIILGFLGIIAVIMILTAGFQWMMAGGAEDKVKEAKDRIKNAVIGIGIVMAAYIIVNFAVSQLDRATGPGGQQPTGGGETQQPG